MSNAFEQLAGYATKSARNDDKDYTGVGPQPMLTGAAPPRPAAGGDADGDGDAAQANLGAAPRLDNSRPRPARRADALPSPVLWSAIGVLAAGGLYVVGAALYPRPPVDTPATPARAVQESKASPPRPEPAPAPAPQNAAMPAPEVSPPPAPAPARLAAVLPAPLRSGEAAPLGVAAEHAPEGGMIVVSGLAPGATLSAGHAVDGGSWWLPLADLASLTIRPPTGFVGAMNVAVELRRADTSVGDRKLLRFEWSEAAPAQAAPAEPPQAAPTAAAGTLTAAAIANEPTAPALDKAALDPQPMARSAAPAQPTTAPPPPAAAPTAETAPQPQAAAEPSTTAEPKPAEAAAKPAQPQEGQLIDDEYTAGCLIKIDGRVLKDGDCPVRWTKAPAVTYQFENRSVRLVREKGRVWKMALDGRDFGKLRKTESCWSGRRVYICERDH